MSACKAPTRVPLPPAREEQSDGSITAWNLFVLRLADLLQVQVAAVEQHVDGDRDHHSDHRIDGVDPDAERRCPVISRRARHQVCGQHRAAGARAGDRGSGRTEPAGEEAVSYTHLTLPTSD